MLRFKFNSPNSGSDDILSLCFHNFGHNASRKMHNSRGHNGLFFGKVLKFITNLNFDKNIENHIVE